MENLIRLAGWLAITLCLAILLVSGIQILVERAGFAEQKENVGLIIGSLAVHGGVLAVLLALKKHSPTDAPLGFGVRRDGARAAILIGLAAAVVMLPVTWLLGHATTYVAEHLGIPVPAQIAVDRLSNSDSIVLKVYLSAFAVLLAPVVEEILFRGVLYPGVKALGHPRLALWGSSVMFALIHMNLMTFIPLLALALILARLYEMTDNLLAPITAHATFNAANLAMLFLTNNLLPDQQ